MPRFSTRTLLTALAFLAFVGLGLPEGLRGVAWPSIRAGFGVPIDALGVLVGFTTAGYLASSFLSGWILRAVPLGTVLSLSTTAAAVGLLGYALAPLWWLMVVLSFLAGLGGGAVDAGLNAYGSTHFTPRILNWLHAFFGLGTTLGPMIATAVLQAGLAWRWSYGVVGAAQALLAVALFATRGRWGEVPALDSEGVAPTLAARARLTLVRPVVWLGMAVFFLYVGMESGLGAWSYSLLTLGRGVPEATAGLVVGLYWGSLMVGRVLFGIVADRVALVAALRLCLLAVIGGALLFWLDPSRALSFAGLLVVGLAQAPIFASLVSLTPPRVGAAHADSAIGFQVAAGGLGGAIITGVVGVLARAAGLEAVGLAFVTLALALLACYELVARATPKARRWVGGGSAASPPPGAASG